MSWLDLLPSSERSKRRRFSPEHFKEFLKAREKIPTVEQIGEQMDKSASLAELGLALELEPKLKDALKKQIEKDLKQRGFGGLFNVPGGVSDALQAQVQQGFAISVDTDPSTQHDQLVVSPEGNVGEKLPLQSSVSDKYVAQFMQAVDEASSSSSQEEHAEGADN